MRKTAVYTLRMGVVVVAAALGASLAAGAVSGSAHATPAAATAPVTAAAAPAAAGSAVAALYRSLGGLSCVGRSFCMGVGPSSIQFPLRRAPAFSQIWNGKAWRAPVGVPSPADDLLSVSCATRKNCLAVGDGAGKGRGQVSDAWNGRRWRELLAPAGSGQSYLNAVACPAARQCIAVGRTGGSPHREYGKAVWAQLWDGTGWSDLAPVAPAGSVTAVFKAVSCPGPANCTAVGYYYTTKSPYGQVEHPLAETWNGSSWTVLPAPLNLATLNAISCPDAAECVVVGNARSHKLQLASAVWNGSAWTSLTVPSPVLKPRLRSLISVSCASPAYCVAVGAARAGSCCPCPIRPRSA